MAGDWIKLHRCITESGLFADDWLTRLWIWCLVRANYGPQTFYGATIHPGEFVTSMENAAEVLGKSKSTVWRGLQKLASDEYRCIELRLLINVKRKFTVITICNWTTYQSTETNCETGAEPKRNGSGTGAEQIEERKKLRKDIFVAPTEAEVGEYCRERSNSVDAAKFVSFYASKGWKIGRNSMKDWRAAVRTWEKSGETHSVVTDRRPKVPPVGSEELLNWKP